MEMAVRGGVDGGWKLWWKEKGECVHMLVGVVMGRKRERGEVMMMMWDDRDMARFGAGGMHVRIKEYEDLCGVKKRRCRCVQHQ